MPNFGRSSIATALLEMMATAIVWGMLMSWCWVGWRLLSGQPILPDRPLVARRPVSWNLGTIFLVFFLYVVVGAVISNSYFLLAMLSPPAQAGAAPAEKETNAGNPKTRAVAQPKVDRDQPRDPGPKAVPPKEKRHAAAAQADEKKVPWSHMMFLNGLVQIIMLVSVPWLLRKTSGARLLDLGLVRENWLHQAAVGVVATLIAAPPVYAVQYTAVKIWDSSEHPLSKMISQEFSVGVGWLAVVTAVILAPMFEEIVFRGLLQSWIVALLKRRGNIPSPRLPENDTLQPMHEPLRVDDSWPADPEFSPVSDVKLSIAPNTLERPGRAWLGIVLTSLLFAEVHAPQWPAPIALFALALVIGTVYYRTGSLITAICMHATFNGISTLMLFMAVLSDHKPAPAKVLGHERAAESREVDNNRQTFTMAICADHSL